MADYFSDSYFAPKYFSPLFGSTSGSISFPTQYSGLRYFDGVVKDLCLVGLGDAPVGDRITIDKNGTLYAVYLVDTTDPDASPIRVHTNDGIKAIRLKT